MVSHASHPKRAEFQRTPNFGILLYLFLHPLTQNNQIQHGNTHGDGRDLEGQPRCCVCTNALHILSATADYYRAMLCISAVFAVVRCPSVCPSVTLVDCIHTAEDIVKHIQSINQSINQSVYSEMVAKWLNS